MLKNVKGPRGYIGPAGVSPWPAPPPKSPPGPAYILLWLCHPPPAGTIYRMVTDGSGVGENFLNAEKRERTPRLHRTRWCLTLARPPPKSPPGPAYILLWLCHPPPAGTIYRMVTDGSGVGENFLNAEKRERTPRLHRTRWCLTLAPPPPKSPPGPAYILLWLCHPPPAGTIYRMVTDGSGVGENFLNAEKRERTPRLHRTRWCLTLAPPPPKSPPGPAYILLWLCHPPPAAGFSGW